MTINLMRLTVLVSTTPTHMKAPRIILYVALVVSFIASLLYRPATRLAFEKGEAQLFIPLLAPIGFALFVIGYSADRYFLVKSGTIPLIRAVMQFGFAMVFLTFLARGELREYKDANEQRAASIIFFFAETSGSGGSRANLRSAKLPRRSRGGDDDFWYARRHIAKRSFKVPASAEKAK